MREALEAKTTELLDGMAQLDKSALLEVADAFAELVDHACHEADKLTAPVLNVMTSADVLEGMRAFAILDAAAKAPKARKVSAKTKRAAAHK